MKDTWDCVSTEVVKKSFIACSISVSTDGTKDSEIHCLKENGIAAPTWPAFKQVITALLALCADKDECDSNPFADLDGKENDDDLACNEIAVEDC